MKQRSLRIPPFLMICCTALTMGLSLACNDKAKKVIKAERFELVDGNGETRGSFAVNDDGSSHLMLYGEEGKVRGALVVEPDGMAGFFLYGKDRKPRGSFVIMPSDLSGFALFHNDGQPHILLRLEPDGLPSVFLYDKMRKRGWFGVDEEEAGLRLYDKDGKDLWKAP